MNKSSFLIKDASAAFAIQRLSLDIIPAHARLAERWVATPSLQEWAYVAEPWEGSIPSAFPEASADLRHYFLQDPRFRTRTHQSGYRQLPAVKWGASFESADDGFSIRHHHAGRISAEPLVAPAQVVGYVLGARCATSRSGLLSRTPTRGLFPDAASHIRVSFGWAPAIKQDGFTGFRCTDSIRSVYIRV